MSRRALLRAVPSVVVVVLVALASLGCQGEPRQLGWEIELPDSAALMRARVVEATIRRGGCEGEELYSVELGRMGPTTGAEAPVLEDGVYGFGGGARDEECVLFAEGCTEATLPTPGPIVVQLAARMFEVPACSSARCSGGFCAGAPDGGGVDGGCRATETACGDGADEDCDGDTDCDDSDCASDAGCDACSRVTCDECEMCRDGTCITADDGTACASGACWGGSCCDGCWNGTACVTGVMNDACGRAGERCLTCEGCGTCTSGACAPLPSSEGMTCGTAGGRCVGGACCTGCSMGGRCMFGDADTACGNGGGACETCGACTTCSAGSCAPADATPCPGGLCRGGACCTGCWNGSTCETGAAPTACGTDGAMCAACLPCQRCEMGMCGPGVAGDVCTSAGSLPGTCRGTPPLCCAGCWDGTDCQSGDVDAACGTRGMMCDVCEGVDTCTGRFCRPL